ncbi:MAG: hypothetical protein ACHREM_17850 [Polyangiales bacterium]
MHVTRSAALGWTVVVVVGCGSSSTNSGPAPTDGAVSDTSVTEVSTTDSGGHDTGPGVSDSKPADTGKGDLGTTDVATADLGTTDIGVITGPAPTLAGCRIFPDDNPWNTDIAAYPVSADSAKYLANMAPSTGLHPDWGTTAEQYGIPISTGTGATPVVMNWTASWGVSESDPLACASGGGNFCYPIPSSALIEGGPSAKANSDRHLLYIDTAGAPSNCTLYEVYNAQNWVGPGWTAQNGAIFHLGSNTLRPDQWTSADAAGLPVMPGLARADEVASGAIHHALRVTFGVTYQGFIHPATHAAGVTTDGLPPMGLRARLKASVDISGYSKDTQVILTALKHYGVIVADNGTDWYISGQTDDAWGANEGTVHDELAKIKGSDFEIVDTGPVIPGTG